MEIQTNLIEDEVIAKVYSTRDYDKFKNLMGNRQIRQSNVSQIQKSSKEEQLLIPIIVNEKMEICDGQHRAIAWRNLGQPIYYIICEGYNLSHVKRANQNSVNWVIYDFLKMYSDLGKPYYQEINNLMRENKIKTHAMIKLISKVTQRNQILVKHEILDGTLELTDDDMSRIKLFLEHLNDFVFYKHFREQTFINAFLDLYFYMNYEHHLMVSKFDKSSHFLSGKFKDKNDALNTLCRMYSYGITKNRIFYDMNTKRLYMPK